jgi:uncharacterized repeat protein (TIGR01451 family)
MYDSTGALVHIDHAPVEALGASGRFYGEFDAEPCPPGESFTVKVEADNYHVVDESDETNNNMTADFTCPEGPQPGGPDLVIDKDVVVYVCPVGDPKLRCCFNVEATVTNIGNEIAGASTACIYINGVHQAARDQDTRRLGPEGESVVLNFGRFVCPCRGDDLVNVTVCADNYNVVAESNEDNNCETNFVDNRVGDIEVTKQVSRFPDGPWFDEIDADFDDIVFFRSTIHNNGCCCDLTGIQVSDTLSDSFDEVDVYGDTPDPDGSANIGGSTLLWWNLPDPLEPCDEVDFFIRARVCGRTGEDTNTQRATATTCTGDAVSDSDTAAVNVQGTASIEVTKEVWDPDTGEWVERIDVNIGDIVLFRSTVHNNGNTDLTYVRVWDMLSWSFTYRGVVDTPLPMIVGTPFGLRLTWFIPGTLEPCDEVDFFIRAEADGDDGDVDRNRQFATGYSAETDEYVNAEPNTAFVRMWDVDMWLNIDDWDDTRNSGADFTFDICGGNDGQQRLNPARLVVTLPDGISYVDAQINPNTVNNNADGTWTLIWNNLGPVNPGVAGCMWIDAHINDDTPPGIYTCTAFGTADPDNGHAITRTDSDDMLVTEP